jgi:hypothetical protein
MVALAALAACGDDFEPLKSTADAGSDASGGSAGAAGTSGAAGAAAGASGAAGADAGMACQSIDDCGDPTKIVCDPVTATCAPAQCTDTKPCDTNERCLYQNEDPPTGVCYPTCMLGGSPPCAGGATCMPHWGGPEGTCVPAGTGAAGEECTLTEGKTINTGCVTGYRCSLVVLANPEVACRPVCDAWGDALTCTEGSCFLGSCTTDYVGVSVGNVCFSGTTQGPPCANDGAGHHQGICMSLDGINSTCVKLCRISEPSDCTSPQTCNPFDPTSEIGLCL